ncbi:MAG TPA: FAD-binding oxidoreductase [Steroidobacteraceae bacterium]|nr:FAD-binding oxidoreductase [Steroidobacteraceae bacterium]
MARPVRIKSYYAASAHAAPDRAELESSVDCDVCVVGGGIAGCSAALHLAERGYKVVLLDEYRVGWGASGRSGAQAIHGVASGQTKLERLIGAAAARTVWDVSVEGLALMRELISRHRIDCDWTDGYLMTAVKQRHLHELHTELDQLQNKLGYTSVRYVPRDELRSILGTSRYVGALYDSYSGHLHPLNYTLGLAAAAASNGVMIFEGTRALGFRQASGTSGATVRIRTPRGEVRAHDLVLCGNVYLGDTAPALATKIIPIGSHIVATEPLGAQRARELIANNAAVCDMNWVLDYYRCSADHRLLFGGRVSHSGFGSFDAMAATRERMLRVFPQLADARIDYSWGGYVDATLNRAPNFGRLASNIYFLQGFSGHGIALTGIAGKLVAQAIAGTAERFDVFAKIPHRSFPGTALRRPALALAMLYYRLRDLL